MEKLYSWTATRSGAGITIKAKTRQGSPVTLVGVTKITGGAEGCIAHAPGGQWLLGGDMATLGEVMRHHTNAPA